MYEYEREELVNKLKRKGIEDQEVLRAFSVVERHLFVPEAMHLHAYKDNALPIGYGQTISQPYTVAYMTQALGLRQGDKVLEIGTGSGFQAAVLAAMDIKVYTIERNFEIFSRTQKLFDKLGIRAATKCGDGTIGWSQYAPYEGIIVTAGGPTVPKNLLKQIAVNGRMVIPVGDKKSQILHVITKEGEEDYKIEKVPSFAFVPLIGREGWKEGR